MAIGEKKEIVLPVEFSGTAQLMLFTRYGDPREAGWENKWITPWAIKEQFPWFPEREVCIHKHFRPILEKAFINLTLLGLNTEIKTFDGAHKLRNISGSNTVLSVHAWGAAIDLNATDNPLGSEGKWSEKFIEIMTTYQVFCGQSWTGRKDPMHFAMVNG